MGVPQTFGVPGVGSGPRERVPVPGDRGTVPGTGYRSPSGTVPGTGHRSPSVSVPDDGARRSEKGLYFLKEFPKGI